MKVTELNGAHLGKTVTATIDHASVTDVLTGVSHEADLIMELNLSGRRPEYAIGRSTAVLTFQRAGEVRADERAEIIIHGEPETADSPQSTTRSSN